MTGGRTRGRPRAGDGGDRRAAILDAARTQFAAKGFAGTSMRGVAAEAGVDVSLIGHYFGGKDGLLVATMELPVDPIGKITGALAGGPDGMAERLLRTFLEAWDPHRETFCALVRTTLGSGDQHAPMLEVARNILVTHLVAAIEGDDRELRATLVASQVIGMATARYVVRLEPLASASVDDVVRVCAPSMQALLA